MTDAENSECPRWFAWTRRLCTVLVNLIRAIHSGFWMGVLRETTFEGFDVHPHQLRIGHDAPSLTSTDLEPWERDCLATRFDGVEKLLLIASDRGREMAAFLKAGLQVTAIEFSPSMLSEIGGFLHERGISERCQLVPRYELPATLPKYSGIWLGREYLSTIHGRNRRVAFLKQLRSHATDHAVLFCSFYIRQGNGFDWRLNQWLGNLFRILTGNSSVPVELGDHLDPEVPMYHHHYLEAELRDELEAAGWRLQTYSCNWFGYATATPLTSSPRPLSPTNSLQQA